MVKFHSRYSEKSIRLHRDYLREIIDYLKKHPEEVNLYKLINFYTYALGRNDSLSEEAQNLLAQEPWSTYNLKYNRMWRHDHFMSPNEYTEWLLQKFPQWKGIFYY
ncbi:MAG: hypothetical protein BZ136_08875 [Methanosphaera sp. rholeuAM74]|nr:MAG: hypothetical protein BZ136_08875 [Methanosphaera sp. rholeuAM74]